MAAVPSLAFGQLLARYRLAAGFTQEALAARAGVSARGISDLERGVRRIPYQGTLARLAEALSLVGNERQHFFAASGRAGSHLPEPTRFPQLQGAPLLVGRARETLLLAHHLAGEGAPGLLLAGEPGIGKTRLLSEAAAEGGARGMRVLEGACSRSNGQMPYAPLLEALERFIAQTPRLRLRSCVRGCAWLVRLLPELAEMALVPLPKWDLPPAQERRLMFAAVARFLRNIAGPTGTLLLLDDLQWAGADALSLLAWLLRTEAGGSLRLVGAYRDTELHACDLLAPLLADLARDGLVGQVTLEPLTAEDARALVTSVLPGSTEDSLAQSERIVRRAGGVPFFLISCVQALRSSAPEQDGGDNNVPWTLVQTIRQRVAELPEATQVLIAVTAVAGGAVPGALLNAVAKRPEEEVLSALDGARQARLLVEVSEDSYRMAHDLIGEVVVGQLSTRQRKRLSQRLAEALEQLPGEASVEQLAYHYGRAGNINKEVEYLLLSGDRALSLHAHAEAERAYRDVVERLDRLGRCREAAGVREKLGAVLVAQAHFDQGMEALEPAAAIFQALGDVERRVEVATAIARMRARQGDSEGALARLQQESGDLSQLSARGQALYHAALTYPLGNTGHYTEELSAAERAIQFAGAAQVYPTLHYAEIRRGHALTMLGRLEEARSVLEAIFARVRASSRDREVLCSVLNQLSTTCTALGDNLSAMDYAEHAVETARQLGELNLLLIASSNYGWSAYLLGNWDQAQAHLGHATSIAGEVTASWATPYALLNLGILSLVRGQSERAWEHIARGNTVVEQTRDLQLTRWLQQELAEADLIAGNADAARIRLEPLFDQSGQESIDTLAIEPCLAWAYLELGDERRAAALLDHSLTRSVAMSLRPTLVAALRVQSMLSTRQRHWGDAAAALDQGLDLARAMHSPYDEVKLLLTSGELSMRTRGTSRARERFEQALTLCARLGERLYAGHIRRRLAEL